jgi:proteic killer suppression protein
VIQSFANTATRQFAETGKSKFSGLDQRRARSRLADLDGISSLDEVSRLKSIGLHKLSGNLRDRWAMTINGPWRLVFRFENGHAYDVEIVDYH